MFFHIYCIDIMGKSPNHSLTCIMPITCGCEIFGKPINLFELLDPYFSTGDVRQTHHPYNLLKKTINTHIQLRDYYPLSELPSSIPFLLIKVLRIQCARAHTTVAFLSHTCHLGFCCSTLQTLNGICIDPFPGWDT